MSLSQSVLVRLIRGAVSRAGALTADEQNAMSALDSNFTASGYDTSEVVALIAAANAVVDAHAEAAEVTDLDTVVADLEAAADIDPSEGGV